MSTGYDPYPAYGIQPLPPGEPTWKDIQLPNREYRLLVYPGVLKILSVSDEQVIRIDKIQSMNLADGKEFSKENTNLSQTERAKVLPQWETEQEKKLQKLVEEILTPAQLQALENLNSHEEEIAKFGGRIIFDAANPNVQVDFQGTKITDAGLEHLKGLPQLDRLLLRMTEITDAGIKNTAGLKNLKTLWIGETKVTDAGLQHIEGLTQLTELALGGLNITDAGLEHLQGMKHLQVLQLTATKVTDAGLERLKGLTQLRVLQLKATAVTDAGLEKLNTLANLRELHLHRTPVTGAGLENLPALTLLDLSDTLVNDDGLAHIKGLPNLSVLALTNAKITDAGLEHLQGLKQFTVTPEGTTDADTGLLLLNKTNITDAGLKHLYGLKGLRGVDLSDTKVTAAGVRDLKQALPECKIEWNSPTEIE